MLSPRLIARLDIKGPNLTKGICFEGLRVIGDPAQYAKKYANEGAHEILFIDTVSSLYGRPQFDELLERTVADVFVPVTVAGGVQSVSHVRHLLRHGADKVAVNTAAVRNPRLISDIAAVCGSQAIVVSIEAKRCAGGWEAYVENGRQKTGKDAVVWAREAVGLGAGEILLTSVDQDGTMRGMDCALLRAIGYLPVPVILCGGMGSVSHMREAFAAGADAVACGAALHREKLTFKEMEDGIRTHQGELRREAGSGRRIAA